MIDSITKFFKGASFLATALVIAGIATRNSEMQAQTSIRERVEARTKTELVQEYTSTNTQNYSLTKEISNIFHPAQKEQAPSLEEQVEKIETRMNALGSKLLIRSAEARDYLEPQDLSGKPQVGVSPHTQNQEQKSKNPGRITSLNYRPENLMSDEFFTDSDYLSKEDISHILIRNRSGLIGKGVEDKILAEAKKRGVNPALILSRGQIEHGLITKKKINQRELRYGMGYGCFDNQKKLESRSLDEQIENATRILRKHYDNFEPHKKVKLDYGKTIVIPENAATYALYAYTPHRRAGRLNNKVLHTYIFPEIK